MRIKLSRTIPINYTIDHRSRTKYGPRGLLLDSNRGKDLSFIPPEVTLAHGAEMSSPQMYLINKLLYRHDAFFSSKRANPSTIHRSRDVYERPATRDIFENTCKTYHSHRCTLQKRTVWNAAVKNVLFPSALTSKRRQAIVTGFQPRKTKSLFFADVLIDLVRGICLHPLIIPEEVTNGLLAGAPTALLSRNPGM